MPSFIYTLLEKVGLASPVGSAGEAVVLEIAAEERVTRETTSEASEASEAAEPIDLDAHRPRRLTLEELMSESVSTQHEAREADLARSMGLDVALKTIFETAGLEVPEHGWTVDKALSFIRKATSKGMTPVQVRASLEQAIVQDGGDIREVARDAVAKDEVLDVYERELESHVGAYLDKLAGEVEDLEHQIDALRERISDIEEQRAGTTRRLTAWKSEKRHLEQQWAKVLHAIAPLM